MQQKQLLLIIGNLDRSVNSKPLLYDSVIKAWTTGMAGLEALLQGSPLQLQSGDMLLGLLSWHLYPDLNIILDSIPKMVHQKDGLVPESGILTIGLHGHTGAQTSAKGLQWSLPLAHLRFYGEPVKRTSSVTSQGSRISLLEFNMTALGCILGGWQVEDRKLEDVIGWISKLAKLLRPLLTLLAPGVKDSWLQIIGETAEAFLSSKDLDRKLFSQLLNLGRNRSSVIERPLLPYFGLCEINNAVAIAKDVENKIKLLRGHTAAAGISSEHALIRYVSDDTNEEEFASARPRKRPVSKRASSEEEKDTSTHTRWVHSRLVFRGDALYMAYDSEYYDQRPEITLSSATTSDPKTNFEQQTKRYSALGEEVLSADDERLTTVERIGKGMRLIRGPFDTSSGSALWEPIGFGTMKHYECWVGDPNSAAVFIRMDQVPPKHYQRVPFVHLQDMFDRDGVDINALASRLLHIFASLGSRYTSSLRALSTMNHLYVGLKQASIDVRVVGQPLQEAKWVKVATGAEFFLPRSAQEWADPDGEADNGHEAPQPSTFSRDDPGSFPNDYFEGGMFGTGAAGNTEPEPVETELDISDSAQEAAGKALQYLMPWKLGTELSFSIILWFENSFDIHPDQLCSVMAISSGNSMFIAPALLSDPTTPTHRMRIRHVMGNVGRPGTALLVPPVQPRMMQLGFERWHLINFAAWDGLARDCFQDSSLHLWFTGSTQEVDIGYTGAQDKEIYILESVVSLYGKGEWVADLDILKALQEPALVSRHWNKTKGAPSREPAALGCGHEHGYCYDRMPLATIENWSELMEPTQKSCIFLAAGNWQARLAAMMICVAQDRRVRLLSDPVCWACVLSAGESQKLGADPIMYIY